MRSCCRILKSVVIQLPIANTGVLLKKRRENGSGKTADGRFKFVIAEGESVAGPIPATGNTNTRGFFAPDVRTFLKAWIAEGPTHHFALGIGHHAETIRTIGELLGIESVTVSPHAT